MDNFVTHITQDGMPVRLLSSDTHTLMSLVRTRTGRDMNISTGDIHPVGSEEAERILEDVGLRSDQASQEDDSHRTTLARWTQCVDEARQALQDGITTVLGTTGVDGPGHASRRRLEQALDMALTELASFRP